MEAPPIAHVNALALLKWHKFNTPGFAIPPENPINPVRAKWVFDKWKQYAQIKGMAGESQYFKNQFDRFPPHMQHNAKLGLVA